MITSVANDCCLVSRVFGFACFCGTFAVTFIYVDMEMFMGYVSWTLPEMTWVPFSIQLWQTNYFSIARNRYIT